MCYQFLPAVEFHSYMPRMTCPLQPASHGLWQSEVAPNTADFVHRWRGSGVACPVFSLRTRDSVGVGEFLDINRLVDVCCMAGGRVCTPCRLLQTFALSFTMLHSAAHSSDVKTLYAGMRLIQLLPVNDTSVNMMWWDSYPYSSLSVRSLQLWHVRHCQLVKLACSYHMYHHISWNCRCMHCTPSTCR